MNLPAAKRYDGVAKCILSAIGDMTLLIPKQNYVQPLVRALPLTAAVDALRGNMLQGMNLRHLTFQVGILLARLVAPFAVFLRIFRWR